MEEAHPRKIDLITRAFVTLVLLALSQGLAFADAPSVGTIETIAGSGYSGVADGPRLKAQFLMPAGVAVSPNGTIFVSDSAAQRIKAIFPDGVVRTVAGGGPLSYSGLYVRGGYRDGQGAQARFDRPTGLAVGKNGELYIADTNNHCIRVLYPGGRVETFSGSAHQSGIRNGPRSSALFTRPLGVAVDTDGNLYVADVQLRKISRNGDVSSLPFGSTPLGVATFGDTLLISDLLGIAVVSPERMQALYPSTTLQHQCILGNVALAVFCSMARRMAGDALLGYPLGIVGVGQDNVLFTDARTNTLRLLTLSTNTLDVVGGVLNEDNSGDSGGFRDGPLSGSRYDAPYALARTADGGFILADAGNKRVRALRLSHLPQGVGEIGVFGGVSVYYATSWETSVEGLLEEKLREADQRSPVAVLPDTIGSGDLLQRYLAVVRKPSQLKTVVLDLHPAFIATLPGTLSHELSTFHTYLSAHHSALLCLTYPLPRMLSAIESPWQLLLQTESVEEMSENIDPIARESCDGLVDMSVAFRGEIRSAHRKPLYGLNNEYLAARGRELVAEALAYALQQRNQPAR